uniref:non-specific serine/threonine protein kinase n=2 Tax=Oryza brachyantha TaxID=4533 RepID=J3L283_ORYBR
MSPIEQSMVNAPRETSGSPPPVTSPSPPPPALPPPSPPPASKSPPPPSPATSPPSSPPATSTPQSHQSPPERTSPPASPPPSPSGNSAPGTPTTSPPPNGVSSSTPPARTGTSPPAPREMPLPGTPPSPPVITTQAPPILPPPMGVTVIMPSSGTPASTSQSPPVPTAGNTPAPPLAPPAGAWGGNVSSGLLVGVAFAGFLLALASMSMFLCLKNRGRRRRPAQMMNLGRRNTLVVPERVVSPDVYQPSNGPAASPSGTTSYDFSGTTSCFTYDELAAVTGGFTQENEIGEGGFGKVYIGALGNGRRVAIKQLKVGSGQGEKEFRAEVDIIGRIHHRHLVTLVGYCVTEHHRLLVYEFVSNKTLEHHLHGRGLAVMDWPKRMKIAIGSARGLTYLHEDCHPRIIHRDIKSANILLDDAFEAKVADFGLAKFTNDSLTHISTRVMGTFGYMAPEYASSGKLTDRSDVFSFGVVLLELITGRKPVDSSQPLGEESLVEWARPLLVDALETDDFRELADPALERRYSRSEMRRMVEAAAACIRHSVAKRPRMVQVWRSLDVDGGTTDLTNGVKLGQSTAYDSNKYSADIELFRRMAFANDLSSAELGYSDEDDASSSSRPKPN